MEAFLVVLADYAPSMKDVIWTVPSNRGICGYIITEEQGRVSVQVYRENTTIINRQIREVICKY